MSKFSKLELALEALPTPTGRHKKWSLEEDSAILKFCKVKGVAAVARVLGTEASTVKNRLRVLEALVEGKK